MFQTTNQYIIEDIYTFQQNQCSMQVAGNPGNPPMGCSCLLRHRKNRGCVLCGSFHMGIRANK